MELSERRTELAHEIATYVRASRQRVDAQYDFLFGAPG